MPAKSELPIIQFDSAAQFEAWLSEQPRTSQGLWLKLAKKNAGMASISHAESIDSALCHGWIDSQSDKLDDDFWLLRYTPRKAQSKWSQRNCSKATELIEQGRMTSAGLAEVERAKADGRWDAAYAPPSTAQVPDDLQLALDLNPVAKEFFERINKTNRYAVTWRVATARKPETRAARVTKIVTMLANHEKFH